MFFRRLTATVLTLFCLFSAFSATAEDLLISQPLPQDCAEYVYATSEESCGIRFAVHNVVLDEEGLRISVQQAAGDPNALLYDDTASGVTMDDILTELGLSAENKDSILGSFCEAYIVDGDGNLLQYPLTCETLRDGSALETTFFFPAEVLPESGTVLVSISYGVVDEPGHPEDAQLQKLFVPVPVK